jgi:hypothetical protein
VLSAGLLCASTALHLATYFGRSLTPGDFTMHVAVLAMAVIAIGHMLAQMPLNAQGAGVSWSFMTDGMPRWARVLLQAACLYAFVNFAIFMATTPYSAEQRNGEYVLTNHGQVVRVVSRAEYEANLARELRGLSGHWILFSLVPALVFTVRRDE